jgi:transglutaminase-like putative cysteine protease
MRSLLYTQNMEKSSAPGNVIQNLSNGRLWDWKAALLALAIVEISSMRLAATEWVPFLYFTQIMGGIGVILGLALGYSKFSRQIVISLSVGYTLLLFPAQLLGTVEKTGWLWQDILVLLDRLFVSLDQFIRNRPVDDYLFFISIVTLVYWGIGLSAGYWLTRHGNYLNVVLPSGLAILTVQAFDSIQSKHIWEIALFIYAALLLLGRMSFLQNRSFWRKTHFLLTDDAMNDLERGTLVVTAVAVFISWSLPGFINGIKPAAQAWKEFSQPIFDKYSNAVSALDSPYAEENAGGDFYSETLSLGQQAALGDTPVFTVDLKKNQLMPVRSYWKGISYDLYLSGRWTNVSDSSTSFIPANELAIEYPQARHEMNFTFTSSVQKQNLFYAPAETIWVSKSADILATPISSEIMDVTAWVATTSLSSGDQYKVRALIADPSIEELRSAGAEYPDWVRERYLQVPEEIAPKLRELAAEITGSRHTVYDKVQAITSYLRKEIKYDTKVENALPENRDPVLWVLFDYKKGFCMYYASAETLMLRSIGIPARMAVGFVEGAYDELKGQYVVTYKDSHAWPEVYFPGIGWVEFEPTGNQFPIQRPETKNNFANGTTPASETAEELAVNPKSPIQQEGPKLLSDADIDNSAAIYQKKLYAKFLLPAFVLLALGFSIFSIRRYSLNERLPVYLAQKYKQRGNVPPRWLNRWVRWTKLSQIERAFQTVNLSLSWLGQPQPAYITSQERAEVLIKHLPSAQDQTLSLLQEYQNAMYTPRDGNLAAARKAAVIILLKTSQTRIKETLQFGNTRYNQLK